jgi:hypothetical protein
MIWLYNSKSLVGSYKNFEDVCDYFMRLEHFKAANRGSFYSGSFPEEKWEFSYYSHEHLCAIVGGIEQDAELTKVEWEAYENGIGLIEVCAGDPQMLQQIPLFPDVDVEELARDWSFDYAWDKNFSLFELVEENPGSGMSESYGDRLFSLTR